MDEMIDKMILNYDVFVLFQLEFGNLFEDFIIIVGYVKFYFKWEDFKCFIMFGYSVFFIEG